MKFRPPAGFNVVTQSCDVAKLDQVERLADLALQAFGNVHIVCSNAGVGIPTPVRNIK